MYCDKKFNTIKLLNIMKTKTLTHAQQMIENFIALKMKPIYSQNGYQVYCDGYSDKYSNYCDS